MILATDPRNIAIVCRDFGFIPQGPLGFRCFEPKSGSAHLRKGSNGYARVITEQLGAWRPGVFDEIIIVGDGEGDVLFCKNVENLFHGAGLPTRVRGLFIAHSSVERFRGSGGNVDLYKTWKDLSDALRALLSSFRPTERRSEGALVMLDVDRTILFPRLERDIEFDGMRTGGVSDYVMGFRALGQSENFDDQIRTLVCHASDNLAEYRNQFDEICFKNEEVVAIAALLMAVGTVIPKWVSRESKSSLIDLIRRSIRKLEHGGWISGLDLVGSNCVRGEQAWDRKSLTDHLTSILGNYNSSKPVLSPNFRLCEAVRINNLVKMHGADIFNLRLLQAIKPTAAMSVVFISDKPSASLGFVPESLDTDLGGGVFWSELRKWLHVGVE